MVIGVTVEEDEESSTWREKGKWTRRGEKGR